MNLEREFFNLYNIHKDSFWNKIFNKSNLDIHDCKELENILLSVCDLQLQKYKGKYRYVIKLSEHIFIAEFHTSRKKALISALIMLKNFTQFSKIKEKVQEALNGSRKRR